MNTKYTCMFLVSLVFCLQVQAGWKDALKNVAGDVAKQALSAPNTSSSTTEQTKPSENITTPASPQLSEEDQAKAKEDQLKKDMLSKKLDLGPLVLGSTLEDVKAIGEVVVYQSSGGEVRAYLRPNEPIKYAKATVQRVKIMLEENILVEAEFMFPNGYDTDILRKAFNSKYGKYLDYDTDSCGGFGTPTVTYYWGEEPYYRNMYYKLNLTCFNGHAYGKDTEFLPSLRIKSTAFLEKIKTLKSEREQKEEAERKAKESSDVDSMLDAL